jgi:hypothetical protein
MRGYRVTALEMLRALFQQTWILWLPTIAFSAEWVRIGPDWRDEKPQTKFIAVPFQEWTAIFEINLTQRLNQLLMCSAELSNSRNSIEVKLYSAIVNRTTNEFPEEFSASLDFSAWRSADKRPGELLGKVQGKIHLNPNDSQFPIASTKVVRTVVAEAKVVFFYEWKMTIPLTETVDAIPAYLEGWGTCDCASYEAGASDSAHSTLFSYWMKPKGSHNAKPTTDSLGLPVAITSDTRLPAKEPPKVKLSISQAGTFLRIDCSPIPGMKVLEHTAFSERGLHWQAIDRTTNEVGVHWFILPKHDNGIFRVRVD